jgi:hypothetical protein
MWLLQELTKGFVLCGFSAKLATDLIPPANWTGIDTNWT